LRGCAGCGGHAGASTGRVRPREACGKTRARRAAAAWCLMSGRVMGMLRMAGPGVERSVFFASPRGAAARKTGVRRVKREATPSDDNSNSCEKAEAEEESLARNEEEESQTTESDLWSFIGSSESEERGADGSGNATTSQGDPEASQQDEGESDADLLRYVNEDFLSEATQARQEKDELEVVRLQLEAKAQNLAEEAVESREQSDLVTKDLNEIKDKLEEAGENERLALEGLQKERELLTKAREADGEEEKDWLEETLRVVPEESGVSVDESTSPDVPVDAVMKSVQRVKVAEEAHQDSIDRRTSLGEDIQALEAKVEALENKALESDRLAAEAMAEVELAVAAEMAAEARMEECENKIEEAIKEKKKELEREKKQQQQAAAEAEPSAAVEEAVVEPEERDDSSPVVGERVADKLVQEKEKDSSRVAEAELVTSSTDAVAEEVVPKAEPQASVEESQELVLATPPPKSAKSSKFFSGAYFSSDQKVKLRDILSLMFRKKRFAGALLVVMLSGVWLSARLDGGKGLGPVLNQPRQFVSTVASKISSIRDQHTVSSVTKDLLAPTDPATDADAVAVEEKEAESGLTDTLWLLATSVVVVPLISKMPGGSPVLGFLLGGALLGPNALGIINNLTAVRHIAELGVIFLLFNIGLELSFERLLAMQKYVFGLGTFQVVLTMLAAAGLAAKFMGLNGSGAVIIGAAMALSSTAVALQVLQDRGEGSSRHGRATFSVLLFQDLAVVVFLMLVPLLESSGAGTLSVKQFSISIGQAVLKAVAAIAMIIAGGRLMFRPIYKRIAKTANAEIFAATTLLVVLGTSMLTQKFGLSMELGAFIAGLLLAETEYALQVESDIAPYRGLLLGLFFMTVGMEFSLALLTSQWKTILTTMAVLLVGKTLVVGLTGTVFGLSKISALRAGLMLAPGGEFAFVLLGEAVARGIVQASLCSQLYLVVAIGMALTPFLAEVGDRLGAVFDQKDVLKLQPTEGEVDDLRGHVIVAGFGRVGQMICQLLGERLIPFVALDVRSDRVAKGRGMEMPVYFGDCGSKAVLNSIGASKASCAVIVLDTPGANYRCVWSIKKHFPKVKIYVRARDVAHGLNLEKAGATAVVPETLEPSLQLAAAVLQEMQLPSDEIATAIDSYRQRHMSELSELAFVSGSSLGYGFAGGQQTAQPIIPAETKAAGDANQEGKDIVEAVLQTIDGE